MRELTIPWDETRSFVADLFQSGAHFFVIGGTAVNFCLPQRKPPSDLDLILEPSAEMLGKLNVSLARAGAPGTTATAEQFTRGNCGFPSKGVLNIDFLTPPTGVRFPDCWALTYEVAVARSSARVRVASIGLLMRLYRIGQKREPARSQAFGADLKLLMNAARRCAKDLHSLRVWRGRMRRIPSDSEMEIPKPLWEVVERSCAVSGVADTATARLVGAERRLDQDRLRDLVELLEFDLAKRLGDPDARLRLRVVDLKDGEWLRCKHSWFAPNSTEGTSYTQEGSLWQVAARESSSVLLAQTERGSIRVDAFDLDGHFEQCPLPASADRSSASS